MQLLRKLEILLRELKIMCKDFENRKQMLKI